MVRMARQDIDSVCTEVENLMGDNAGRCFVFCVIFLHASALANV